MRLDFKAFLEGGVGSGTKFSVTGLGAGGQAQGGMGMTKPARPQKIPPSEFSPSDTVPVGYKMKNPPGSRNYFPGQGPIPPGWMGAGKVPPKKIPSPLKGGTIGGGSPGVKGMKKK